MAYLKNAAIAKKYQVSDPTVGKWIKLAQQGSNNLELKKVKDRYYIIDNDINHQVLRFLAEKGSKYRNKIGYEKVSPDSEIYQIFNESQLIDLITTLKKGILNSKFTFFGKTNRLWQKYITESLQKETEINENIHSSIDYIRTRLKGFDSVNVVNFFPESNYSATILLNQLNKGNKKIHYQVIHESPEMIQYLQKDMRANYPDLQQDYLLGTFNNDVLRNLLYKNKQSSESKSCNIVLFLELVLGNHIDYESILTNMGRSMGVGDYLLLDAEIDSPKDFELVNRHLNLDYIQNIDQSFLRCLGVSPSMYDLQVKYSDKVDSQAHIFRFKKDVDIVFNFDGVDDIVQIRQGQEIVGLFVHTFKLSGLIQFFQKTGFNISHFSSHPNRSEVLFMCEMA